eukprot:TRINITY_DN390_c0_g2_i2.p1 TRINITY_DN390_c0_g2~~TRINITY_DN390_c0_g2_i2.p1  ORF type:complete len:226 (+),score=89.97 TRINITY_DN390_c0_g2_i2:45-680(+)
MSPTPTRSASVEKALAQAKTLDQKAAKVLEEYVALQITDETYDLDANLSLLKLYQFYPDEANADIILKLLLKALLEMPSNAFILSTYLIPERFHQKKEIIPVLELQQLLEECRFQEFWESPHLAEIPSIPGFESAVRDYAYDILAISHQRCDEALASRVLKLTGNTLKLFLKNKNANLAGGVVTFPLTEFNQRRQQEVQSTIDVGYVARVF